MSSQESQEHRIKIDSLLRQLEQVVAEKGGADPAHSASQSHPRSHSLGREFHAESSLRAAAAADSWRGSREKEEEDPDESHEDDVDMDDQGNDDEDSDRAGAEHGASGRGGNASAAQRGQGQVFARMLSRRGAEESVCPFSDVKAAPAWFSLFSLQPLLMPGTICSFCACTRPTTTAPAGSRSFKRSCVLRASVSRMQQLHVHAPVSVFE
jgi:hypothetical protein